MILIDYSGIAIAPIAMGAVKYDDENLIRHMILNSIRMYRQKHRNEYGEIVVIADGGGNWRKDLFPNYKFKRDSDREASKIDWNVAFKNINKVYEEIGEYLPYKTIRQYGCEADDTIAEIAHWTQEFGNYEPVLIVSADKDFIQLQKFKNINQYSPRISKFIKETDPVLYLKNHILSGDKVDAVPNVLSDDDAFTDPNKRQSTLSAKKREALLEDPKALGQDVYRNYQRNKSLIDLMEARECPASIREDIINNFTNQNKTANKNKTMNYLIENRCRLLLETLGDFIDGVR